ncbi:putative quinol monooxygenase [Klebsiella variicola]|nr:antibiotic biosynthesis monooxygenase family protein [Klebsiella variicola]
MRDLSPVPEQTIASPRMTRNSLTVFMIKPATLDRVIQATLRTAETARAADGNLRYDFFQDISEPQRLAIFQRWESSDALESWRHQDPVKVYEAFLTDSREAPAGPLWRPVKDIGR